MYNQKVTDAVTWPDDGTNPSCNSVRGALQAKGTGHLSCEAVDIESGGITYTFTFNSPTSEARPLITALTTSLTGSATKSTVLTQEPSPQLAGNFTITFDGVTTDQFEFNASADTIEAELNAKIPSLDNKLMVEGWGTGDGVYHYLIFGKRTGDMDDLVVTGVELTGGQDNVQTIETTELLKGSDNQFWWEVPNEFLYTTETETQLQLTMDG